MATAEKKIADFIDEFDNAMLVTRTASGELRSRPMAIAQHHNGGDLRFVTSMDSGKIDEVERDPHVNVAFQKSNTYLSVTGDARIVKNKDVIDEVWSPEMKVWFPDGKESDNLVVLEVKAKEGEFWNMDARHRLAFLVKAGKALMKHEAVQDDPAGEHAKTKL